ncbi:PaaI family thioesterase [Pseudomaricurvus sp.]|uniref:PaaI family thioesterase n=1 Tax=Pseudomaricurvus sp. TaxID=2004510 RepID=UPI003F6CCB26
MTVHQPLEPAFNKFLGIKVDEWEEGHVRISAEVKPEHSNSHGIPHGGFICSLLDVACSLPGMYCPSPDRIRRAFTLSLNTSFVGQAQTNQLYAVGKITSAGYKIFHSSAEVYDSNDTLLATGQSILKYRKGCEDPEGMPLEQWHQLVNK